MNVLFTYACPKTDSAEKKNVALSNDSMNFPKDRSPDTQYQYTIYAVERKPGNTLRGFECRSMILKSNTFTIESNGLHLLHKIK